jgi:hypothetical protein
MKVAADQVNFARQRPEVAAKAARKTALDKKMCDEPKRWT